MERVVFQTVFIESVIELPLGVVGVVKERQCAAAMPLLDALRRQEMMSGFGEHHRRSEKHEPRDPRRKAFRPENRKSPTEARSHQRHWTIRLASNPSLQLIGPPRERARCEIESVESRVQQHN